MGGSVGSGHLPDFFRKVSTPSIEKKTKREKKGKKKEEDNYAKKILIKTPES